MFGQRSDLVTAAALAEAAAHSLCPSPEEEVLLSPGSCPSALPFRILFLLQAYSAVGMMPEAYVRDAVAAHIWDARSDDLESLGLAG